MAVLVTNNASTTANVAVAPGDTSIVVATSSGSLFPTPTGSDWFMATLVDISNNIEIVKCTARSGDTLTVVRAQEGTTARSYPVGSKVELRATAAVWNNKLDKDTGGTVAGTLNASGTLQQAGVQVATISDPQTLTNKRRTQRVTNNGATTIGTITPTGDLSDQYELFGLTGAITVAIPSGTPTAGQKLLLRFKDNGVARAITWTTTAGGFRAVGVVLPSTTVAGKNLYVGCIYNASDAFWDAVGVGQE